MQKSAHIVEMSTKVTGRVTFLIFTLCSARCLACYGMVLARWRKHLIIIDLAASLRRSMMNCVTVRAPIPPARRNAAGRRSLDDVLPRGESWRAWEASRDADTDDGILRQPWRLPRLSPCRIHWEREEVRTVRRFQWAPHTGAYVTYSKQSCPRGGRLKMQDRRMMK